MPESNQLLRKAAQLAKSGQREQARQLIIQVLREDSQNVVAWWGLATVTNSIEERRQALDKVLILKPDHQQARALLAQLEAHHPPEPEFAELPLDDVPAFTQATKVAAQAETSRQNGGNRNLLIGLAIALLTCVLFGIVAYAAGWLGSDDEGEARQYVSVTGDSSISFQQVQNLANESFQQFVAANQINYQTVSSNTTQIDDTTYTVEQVVTLVDNSQETYTVYVTYEDNQWVAYMADIDVVVDIDVTNNLDHGITSETATDLQVLGKIGNLDGDLATFEWLPDNEALAVYLPDSDVSEYTEFGFAPRISILYPDGLNGNQPVVGSWFYDLTAAAGGNRVDYLSLDESYQRYANRYYPWEPKSIAVSADGRRLAFTLEGQTRDWLAALVVVDIATGDVISRYDLDYFKYVGKVALNQDGSLAAIIYKDGVIVWDVERGFVITTLEENISVEQGVQAVAFAPVKDQLAVGLKDGRVLLWDFREGDGSSPVILITTDGSVNKIMFSEDGKRLTALGSETAFTWNLETGDELPSIHVDINLMIRYIIYGALSPSGRILAMVYDRSIGLFDVDTGKQITTLDYQVSGYGGIGFSADGSMLAVGDSNRDEIVIFGLKE